MITITGKTYDHRATIKSIAPFRWNPKFKSWDLSGNLSQEQLNALASLNGIEVNNYNEREGHTLNLLDNRTHKQKYGKCEDAPCCGCCGQSDYESNYYGRY